MCIRDSTTRAKSPIPDVTRTWASKGPVSVRSMDLGAAKTCEGMTGLGNNAQRTLDCDEDFFSTGPRVEALSLEVEDVGVGHTRLLG